MIITEIQYFFSKIIRFQAIFKDTVEFTCALEFKISSQLIENFNLYSDEDGVKHIRIKARPNKWHENDCPFCHKSCPAYDKHSSRPTTWRGLDWGGILVEVEYQTHRIICLEHGVYVAEVPWAYPGNRFTKDFDLTVAWFAYPICCVRFTLNIVNGQP